MIRCLWVPQQLGKDTGCELPGVPWDRRLLAGLLVSHVKAALRLTGEDGSGERSLRTSVHAWLSAPGVHHGTACHSGAHIMHPHR